MAVSFLESGKNIFAWHFKLKLLKAALFAILICSFAFAEANTSHRRTDVGNNISSRIFSKNNNGYYLRSNQRHQREGEVHSIQRSLAENSDLDESYRRVNSVRSVRDEEERNREEMFRAGRQRERLEKTQNNIRLDNQRASQEIKSGARTNAREIRETRRLSKDSYNLRTRLERNEERSKRINLNERMQISHERNNQRTESDGRERYSNERNNEKLSRRTNREQYLRENRINRAQTSWRFNRDERANNREGREQTDRARNREKDSEILNNHDREERAMIEPRQDRSTRRIERSERRSKGQASRSSESIHDRFTENRIRNQMQREVRREREFEQMRNKRENDIIAEKKSRLVAPRSSRMRERRETGQSENHMSKSNSQRREEIASNTVTPLQRARAEKTLEKRRMSNVFEIETRNLDNERVSRMKRDSLAERQSVSKRNDYRQREDYNRETMRESAILRGRELRLERRRQDERSGRNKMEPQLQRNSVLRISIQRRRKEYTRTPPSVDTIQRNSQRSSNEERNLFNRREERRNVLTRLENSLPNQRRQSERENILERSNRFIENGKENRGYSQSLLRHRNQVSQRTRDENRFMAAHRAANSVLRMPGSNFRLNSQFEGRSILRRTEMSLRNPNERVERLRRHSRNDHIRGRLSILRANTNMKSRESAEGKEENNNRFIENRETRIMLKNSMTARTQGVEQRTVTRRSLQEPNQERARSALQNSSNGLRNMLDVSPRKSSSFLMRRNEAPRRGENQRISLTENRRHERSQRENNGRNSIRNTHERRDTHDRRLTKIRETSSMKENRNRVTSVLASHISNRRENTRESRERQTEINRKENILEIRRNTLIGKENRAIIKGEIQRFSEKRREIYLNKDRRNEVLSSSRRENKEISIARKVGRIQEDLFSNGNPTERSTSINRTQARKEIKYGSIDVSIPNQLKKIITDANGEDYSTLINWSNLRSLLLTGLTTLILTKPMSLKSLSTFGAPKPAIMAF